MSYSSFSSSISCIFLSIADVSTTTVFSPLKNCSICSSGIQKALQYLITYSFNVFSLVLPFSARDKEDFSINVPSYFFIFFTISSKLHLYSSLSFFILKHKKGISFFFSVIYTPFFISLLYYFSVCLQYFQAIMQQIRVYCNDTRLL